MNSFVGLLRKKFQEQQWITRIKTAGTQLIEQVRPSLSNRYTRRFGRMFRRFAFTYRFSSLIGRIVAINLSGLLILAMGIMYLNQFREGLIDAKVQSLVTQGQIIAQAIAASASYDPADVIGDPEVELEMQPDKLGRSYASEFEFPIIPERALSILNQLVIPIRARATIYDNDGNHLLDSGVKPTVASKLEKQSSGWLKRLSLWFKRSYLHRSTPIYQNYGSAPGTNYEEVSETLKRQDTAWKARINKRTELVLSVSVPIKRNNDMLGVLFLVTPGGEIDKIVSAERRAILRVLLFAAGVSVLLAIVLAGQIARPIRDLSAGATRVAKSVKEREQLPDFSKRPDEIGDLSKALRTMTDSLYERLEAMGRFAADVAHELKNPLTSLRSAVETMPFMKTDEQRNKLLSVILHDVKRMDRLITDISDTSRMATDMAFSELQPFDLSTFIVSVVDGYNALHDDHEGIVTFQKPAFIPHNPQYYQIEGHQDRLGQVLVNLVENAISFSPENGKVTIHLKRIDDILEISVEDEGPGIPPEYLKKVFKRFYTDRPEEHNFGNNSGLGLNISEQIIEAHSGKIWAENILSGEKDEDGNEIRLGARFVMHLPSLKYRKSSNS